MPSLLDNNERYIIAYLRSDRVVAARWGWLVAKLFASAIFFFGFANENQAMIFTGFGTLLLLDLYSAYRQTQFTKSICSAVGKLETRIEEFESSNRSAD